MEGISPKAIALFALLLALFGFSILGLKVGQGSGQTPTPRPHQPEPTATAEPKAGENNCVESIATETVCETVLEPEEYYEEECSESEFNYRKHVTDSGVYDGIWGDCRAWLDVLVENREETAGEFTLTATFTDADGNTVSEVSESREIAGNSSEEFTLEHKGSCKGEIKDYSLRTVVPMGESCRPVLKTRMAEREECREEKILVIECPP